MISQVDLALLETLRRDLGELLPGENVMMEEPSEMPGNAVFLTSTDFTVEEMGIGGSTAAEKEELVETLDASKTGKKIRLSQKPKSPLISVESPPGSFLHEPDDYTVNYEDGTISFRKSPMPDGRIQVRYNIAREVAETLQLKFTLGYTITIMAMDREERERLTLEIIKILYRNRPKLNERGIYEIRLKKGSSREKAEDWTRNTNILKYLVETFVTIEMPVPAIEKIEITKR